MPTKYRKKPQGEHPAGDAAQVEAMKWEGSDESVLAILEWVRAVGASWNQADGLAIRMTSGITHANVGDFIVKSTPGDIHPLRPEIFHATYEVA